MLEKLKSNEKLMRLIETVQTHVQETEIGDRSVVVAYYLLLSFFPLLIVIGNLLPYLSITPETVLPYVREIIPAEIYEFLKPAIEGLLSNNSGGLLSISVFAAIWSSSKGVNALQTALNRAYGVDDRGNFVISRIVSVGMVGLLLMAVIAIALFFSVGQIIMDGLQPLLGFSTAYIETFTRLRWPITLLGLLIILSAIYILIPNAKVRLRYTLPGTIFATLGWMVLAQGFGLYARTFARSISGYQIIGSFIVLMLWLNFAATIVIFGGIINVTLEEIRTGREVRQGNSRVNKLLKFFKEKSSKSDKSDQ
ncbi:YihY/virulence factor BrkB family protein [Enterococcus sp. 669A]|uniref:YihY/virulence factor BrkB family protein n=1 Tax=Candidatus Enterococcus moelleringii TaxID=2815325 RepID=A0ABS3LF43_9ENTE|nr:YihY/virulence factor BrkB family protein [Enterococcus sp. 669A]MBO1308245.1 YihY/virulence factor BrkB family protein [Enterococcus sp. 669A]